MVGLLSSADEGTITSHAEAHDGAAFRVNVEIALDDTGQLLGDVGVHVEMLVPRLLGRVAVLSCTVTSGPVAVASFRTVIVNATRASIWHYHDDATLTALTSIHHLRHCVLMRASKAT